jgi:hypothetical protein
VPPVAHCGRVTHGPVFAIRELPHSNTSGAGGHPLLVPVPSGVDESSVTTIPVTEPNRRIYVEPCKPVTTTEVKRPEAFRAVAYLLT